MSFNSGEQLNFGGEVAVVLEDRGDGGYLISSGSAQLPIVVPAPTLEDAQLKPAAKRLFTPTAPHLISVDDFLDDPDEVREIALSASYHTDLQYFKGLRSDHRFLWPGLREEFSRLLGTPVTEWLGHNANGVFQQTAHDDPLVWHHDSQSYAAAIYLNPNPPPGAGTSFWRDRTYGCSTCAQPSEGTGAPRQLRGRRGRALGRLRPLQLGARGQLGADRVGLRSVQPAGDLGREADALGHVVRALRRGARHPPPGAALLLRHQRLRRYLK